MQIAVENQFKKKARGSLATIGHFTVIDGSEAEGDLVLIQTFFALLWKLFLKNNS